MAQSLSKKYKKGKRLYLDYRSFIRLGYCPKFLFGRKEEFGKPVAELEQDTLEYLDRWESHMPIKYADDCLRKLDANSVDDEKVMSPDCFNIGYVLHNYTGTPYCSEVLHKYAIALVKQIIKLYNMDIPENYYTKIERDYSECLSFINRFLPAFQSAFETQNSELPKDGTTMFPVPQVPEYAIMMDKNPALRRAFVDFWLEKEKEGDRPGRKMFHMTPFAKENKNLMKMYNATEESRRKALDPIPDDFRNTDDLSLFTQPLMND